MSFAEAARALSGRCALLLGWRPADFWDATPQELADVMAALLPADGDAALSRSHINQLMKDHPDEPDR